MYGSFSFNTSLLDIRDRMVVAISFDRGEGSESIIADDLDVREALEVEPQIIINACSKLSRFLDKRSTNHSTTK